jgi:vitamin B12 transporter
VESRTSRLLNAQALSGKAVRALWLVIIMKKLNLSLAGKVALVLCVVPLAFLDNVQAQDQALNPVVVVSSRVNEQLSDALPSVSVIQKEDIDKFRYSDLYELLNGQPGMQLTRSGGAGNPISVSMRGASTTQTMVLIDGIPFASQGAIGAISPLEAIPIAQIERIEILRGNASAVYGPGAAGGVIHIFTNPSKQLAEGIDVKAGLGSLNSQSLQTSIRKNTGDGLLSFSLSDDRSEGISTLTPSRHPNFPNINSDRNGFGSQSYGLGWRQNISTDTEISLNYLNSGTLASYDNPYATSSSERWNSKSSLESAGIQLSLRISENWKTNLKNGQSLSKLSTLTNDALNAEYGTTNSKQQQTRWDNLVVLDDKTLFSFGVASQVDALDAARISKLYADDGSVLPQTRDVRVDKSVRQSRIFGGLNHKTDTWSLRFDLSKERLPGNFSDETYLVGAGYELNQNYKITWSSSTAIQGPTVGQLYDVAFGGNSNLKPEYSVSSEIGLQFKDEKSFWRAVLFDVQYKDMIAAGQNLVDDPFWAKQFVTQLDNLNNAQNQGLEIIYARNWHAWGVQLAFTSQNPEILGSTRPLLNRSKRFGSFAVNHVMNDGITLNAKVLATSERWTPMIGSFTTYALVPGYAVLNLSAQHKISSELQLTYSILNALDKTYFHLDGYNNPVRTFYVNLKYGFR